MARHRSVASRMFAGCSCTRPAEVGRWRVGWVVASGTTGPPRMPHETSSAAMRLEALRARWTGRARRPSPCRWRRTRRPAPQVPARPRRRVTLARSPRRPACRWRRCPRLLNGKPDVSARTRALVRQALLTSGYRKRANDDAPPLVDVSEHAISVEAPTAGSWQRWSRDCPFPDDPPAKRLHCSATGHRERNAHLGKGVGPVSRKGRTPSTCRSERRGEYLTSVAALPGPGFRPVPRALGAEQLVQRPTTSPDGAKSVRPRLRWLRTSRTATCAASPTNRDSLQRRLDSCQCTAGCTRTCRQGRPVAERHDECGEIALLDSRRSTGCVGSVAEIPDGPTLSDASHLRHASVAA